MRRFAQVGRFAAIGFLIGVLPVGAEVSVRERVIARLERAGVLQKGDVLVAGFGDSVTLTGAVPTLELRRAAVKAAAKEAASVVNRLEVVPEKERTEAELRKAVTDAILREPRITIFDAVGFDSGAGVVVLQGSVRQPWLKDAIERRVGKIEGVRAIRNQIAVQGVSIFDDRLRARLARAIYGDDRFVQYAHRADPPIRILVDRGRVTLAGYVASPVEQALLGHIARGFMTFGVDNQVKVDGQDAKEPAPGSRLIGI